LLVIIELEAANEHDFCSASDLQDDNNWIVVPNTSQLSGRNFSNRRINEAVGTWS
jgi:hypothetical protein